MSEDLIELNQSKATSVLNCRIPVLLKGQFTLLAAERGMNVNQLLSIVVDEAVSKSYQKQLVSVTGERDQAITKCKELEKLVKAAQAELATLNAELSNLKKDRQIASIGLQSKSEETKVLSEKHEKALIELERWKSVCAGWKTQAETAERKCIGIEHKLKASEQQRIDILKRNTEVIQSLKKEDKESFFTSIPDWGWTTLSKLPIQDAEVKAVS